MNREREQSVVADRKQKGIFVPYYVDLLNRLKFKPRQISGYPIYSDRTINSGKTAFEDGHYLAQALLDKLV